MLARSDARGRDYMFAEYHPRTRMSTYNQTILTPEWRFTHYPENPTWGEMFNLRSDPGEHVNLFADPDHAMQRSMFTQQLHREFPPAPKAGGPSIATY
jgi:hypothetical protein